MRGAVQPSGGAMDARLKFGRWIPLWAAAVLLGPGLATARAG